MALSAKELAEARKAGFKRKAPKKPKKNAGVTAFQSYLERVKEYERAAKAKAAEFRKRETLKKRVFGA
jgi:hypothetical protein